MNFDEAKRGSSRRKLLKTLSDFEIGETAEYLNKQIIPYEAIKYLLVYPPTVQSHLGIKFSEYQGLDKKTSIKLMEKICQELRLDEVVFYENFESNKENIIEYCNIISPFDKCILYLNTANGLKESFFSGLRNALAHGNIIQKKGKKIILYSVTSSTKYGEFEYKKPLSFLLSLESIDDLLKVTTLLNNYS